MNDRDRDWVIWMAAAIAGDETVYRRLLGELATFLRAVVRGRSASMGLAAGDVEDVVQEALLAIHLKRGTWEHGQPVAPWAAAIARNKLIDALRRKGRRVHVPIEDFSDVLPAEEKDDGLSPHETGKLLSVLKGRQRDVVTSIAVEGDDTRQTAQKLGMSEGAVRVALHRGLATLSAAYRSFRE